MADPNHMTLAEMREFASLKLRFLADVPRQEDFQSTNKKSGAQLLEYFNNICQKLEAMVKTMDQERKWLQTQRDEVQHERKILVARQNEAVERENELTEAVAKLQDTFPGMQENRRSLKNIDENVACLEENMHRQGEDDTTVDQVSEEQRQQESNHENELARLSQLLEKKDEELRADADRTIIANMREEIMSLNSELLQEKGHRMEAEARLQILIDAERREMRNDEDLG